MKLQIEFNPAKVQSYRLIGYESRLLNKEDFNDDTNSSELLTVKLRYKFPDENKSAKLEIPVIDARKNNVSDDFCFTSAVTMFGQLLRDSDFKGDASYDKVISLAKKSFGDDELGYRHEFVRLVESAKGIQ